MLWYDVGRIDKDAFCCCMHSLPWERVYWAIAYKRYAGIHMQTHRLMEGICEVRRWDGIRCHDIHTEFNIDWFRHSKVNGAELHRHTGRRSHTSRLKIERILYHTYFLLFTAVASPVAKQRNNYVSCCGKTSCVRIVIKPEHWANERILCSECLCKYLHVYLGGGGVL
jgi:hypothetical protein